MYNEKSAVLTQHSAHEYKFLLTNICTAAFEQRLMNTRTAFSHSDDSRKPTDGLTFAYDGPARALTARGCGMSYKSPGTSN